MSTDMSNSATFNEDLVGGQQGFLSVLEGKRNPFWATCKSNPQKALKKLLQSTK